MRGALDALKRCCEVGAGSLMMGTMQDLEDTVGERDMEELSFARSPCVSLCALGVGDFCIGCQRSLCDISAWSSMDGARRAAAGRAAAARRAWHVVDGRVRAIMAVGPSGEVGQGAGLPWRLPSELKWFRQATDGQSVVMGRLSWEGMKRALPGRELAVVGSSEPVDLARIACGSAWLREGSEAADWAFEKGRNLVVAGGPSLWRSMWSDIELAWITRVEGPMQADSFFMPDLSEFNHVAHGPSGSDNAWSWRSELWERRH